MKSARAVGESRVAKDGKLREVTISILTDSKLILHDARFRIARGRSSRLDSRQALKDAHHAVELVLRRKAEELNAKPYDFDTLLKTLKEQDITVPYERELDELNKSRVLAQHYGSVLDGKDTYRLVVTAENFMKDFLPASFGVDYDSLSILDPLGNDDVKATLEEAIRKQKAGRFEDAAIAAHLAVQKTKWVIERRVSPTGRGFRRHFHLTFGESMFGDINNALDEISEAVENTRDIALSAPFAQDLKRLSDITRAAFLRILDGPVEIQVMKELRDHEPSSDDADFAVNLAIEFALWADQVYGLSETI